MIAQTTTKHAAIITNTRVELYITEFRIEVALNNERTVDSGISLTQIYLLCVWYSFIFVSKNSLKHLIRIWMELLSPLEKLLAYGLSPCCIISSIFFSWIGSIFQFWSYFISISSQLNPGKWSYPFIRCLIRTVLQTSGDQSATHAINNSESDSR